MKKLILIAAVALLAWGFISLGRTVEAGIEKARPACQQGVVGVTSTLACN